MEHKAILALRVWAEPKELKAFKVFREYKA
jgi:hypothetical protein